MAFGSHSRNRADAFVVLKDVLPLVAGTELRPILFKMGSTTLAAGTEMMVILIEVGSTTLAARTEIM